MLPPSPSHEVETIELSRLSRHPSNPRRGNVDLIAESLQANGQYKPLVAQRKGDGFVVLAGNHTLQAMQQLGYEAASVVVLDVDDVQAQRILLVDNRSSDDSEYDEAELTALLANLSETSDGLTGTGYTELDLSEMMDALDTGPVDTSGGSAANLLSLQDVSVGEPKHKVRRGEVYRLHAVTHDHTDTPGAMSGPHILAVVDVARGWPAYVPHLTDGVVFLPYPGPYVTISRIGLTSRLVMVQPDVYLAGHVLDKWAATFGDDKISLLEAVEVDDDDDE